MITTENHSYNTISSHFTVGVCLTAIHTLAQPRIWFMDFSDFNEPDSSVCGRFRSWTPLCKCENARLIITIFIGLSSFYGDPNSFIDSWLMHKAFLRICKERFMCVSRKEKQMSFEKVRVFVVSNLTKKMTQQKSLPFSINQLKKDTSVLQFLSIAH